MKDKISLSAILEANERGGFRYECPVCGNKFGPIVGDDAKLHEMGEPGSHTLCVKCQTDLVINEDGALRRSTADEMVALFDEDPDAYMLLQDMKAAIRGDGGARNRLVSLLRP